MDRFHSAVRVGAIARLVLLTLVLPITTVAQTGTISGIVVDAESGEPLVAVNVVIDGTLRGTASDLEGRFRIPDVQPGLVSVTFSYVSYQSKQVTGIEVKAGAVSTLQVTLHPEAIGLDEVVVEARAMSNTDASLLRQRQKSVAVSDAISAESISKSGSSDAAAAMTKVTGASVVGGKYVYIRGLGERYSSTHLNGSELPSADPDRRAFQLDLLPSSLLDNIVTLKTFTPDKPGNFSGGLVDVGTKDFPDRLALSFTSSASYNTETTYNEAFLLYSGGKTDWLGRDDGSRSIPAALTGSEVEFPSEVEARRNPDKAATLERLSKAFGPEMEPTSHEAPVNRSVSLAVGNQIGFLGRPLGFSASLTYNQHYGFYGNGDVGRWELVGAQVDQVDRLTSVRRFADTRGSREVHIGALASVSYKPHQNHKIKGTFLQTQNGESTARYLEGYWVDLSQSSTYQTRYLGYKERGLRSLQSQGEHFLPRLGAGTVEWKVSSTKSSQNEPDLRYFTNHYTVQASGDTLFSSPASLYPAPARFFRELEESNTNIQVDYSIPFRQWNDLGGRFKVGGFLLDIDRDFRERRFEYEEGPGVSFLQYGGRVADFFNAAGIIGTRANGQPQFGLYITDRSSPKNNYTGSQSIQAAYAMLELPLMRSLRLIGGARMENTRMATVSALESLPEGRLENNDLLPSVNLVYEMSRTMNLRAAYTHTIARPTFREMAPYQTFDFVGDFVFAGNPSLKRTLIRNSDLRWEWFRRPGEIIALSVFHKQFENPIERVILTRAGNNTMGIQNVDRGMVIGLEAEIRGSLGFIPVLENFQLGGNFSLVHASVDIPESELTVIRAADPTAVSNRPLQGQSPYLVNMDLAYEDYSKGTAIGLYYNVFGPRLLAVTEGAAPDVFEQPRHTLDLVASQRLIGHVSLGFSIKNLLNEDVLEAQRFKGQEFVYQNYPLGRTVSLSLRYTVD